MEKSNTPIDRNKDPILSKIIFHLSAEDKVLEIGSGSGEHIHYFAKHFRKVKWQPSDISNNHINNSGAINVMPAINLDMMNQDWHAKIKDSYNIILTINSLHIMPWQGVVNFWNGCSELTDIEKIIIYGPFRVNGKFKSDSDIEFEKWLKSNSNLSGLRDIADICQLAEAASFELCDNYNMPANNHLLVFIKK